MRRLALAYYCIGIVIFCVDRITKYMALLWLSDSSYWYNSFISFELVINRGISWGLLHSESNHEFIVVSLLIIVVTLILCWHAWNVLSKGQSIFGYVCVIAGSLSNIIDRIYYCGVIDFVLLSYKNFYWPVFNVADVAIVCGVIIILLQDDIWK
jgi:signal peptidase II